MAGLYFLLATLALTSSSFSRSSRNLRNMIHVSIGRRSRSPLSPLSLRMMSRADLMRLPSCCDVDLGASAFLGFLGAFRVVTAVVAFLLAIMILRMVREGAF